MFGNLFKGVSKKSEPKPVIHLYNTETNQLELFEPLSDNMVTMYTCGPTVYDYAHIGNLRAFVFADVLKRTLIFHGYEVNHTINLTDFGHLSDDGDQGEDKMMKGLKREGLPVTLEAMRELSDQYIDAFFDDFDSLRILPPTTWSRASDFVQAQIRLIETLEGKGYVYETSDGVYFDVQKFPRYGCLGKIDINELKSGARVEVNKEKHHPVDFAVWKKGELGWDSRWGKGFPGWHIECSAMAMATLGKEIDIHTGGIDHIPVHHNAEIAQSECATGKKFVRYWLHGAFLTIDNTKISKSLGNTINLRHLFDRGFTGDDYRYWLLTAHYRSPINFSWEALQAAKQALYRLKRYMYEDYKQIAGKASDEYIDKFKARIADDLDTPGAIALLWEATKDTSLDNKTKCATIRMMDTVLDIGLSDDLDEGAKTLGIVAHDEVPTEVQELIDRREAARVARNWLEADTLREAISLKGYSVEDTPHGPKITKL
ncbi:MAG: cysteine--tRNA ligase [Candidatus Nomurabacteria bacterium]|nr:MAG: cysteine--tRNA ligase [Candidatus Nomurabacteria bacterium]